ncbi:MAG: DUF1311 domain-containing protein [Rhodocyclaceae bacterium]|nr:DUF1311 domain-containing protein [Rhodocyclaceae bacterium]
MILFELDESQIADCKPLWHVLFGDALVNLFCGSHQCYGSDSRSITAWAFTTMRKIHFLFLVFLVVPTIAFAEVQCTDRPECWPEGSSMHTGLLLVQQQNAAEKVLAGKHEELIKLVTTSSTEKIQVDERLVAALKTQQAAWLKYRTEECELVGSLTGAGGTWPSTYTNRCEVNHTDQRLRRVRSVIRCIERIPNEKRFFEQNNCLQQLAPLTNK